jgi:hypothetical protein
LRATKAPTGLAPRTRDSRLGPRGGEEKRRRRQPRKMLLRSEDLRSFVQAERGQRVSACDRTRP